MQTWFNFQEMPWDRFIANNIYTANAIIVNCVGARKNHHKYSVIQRELILSIGRVTPNSPHDYLGVCFGGFAAVVGCLVHWACFFRRRIDSPNTNFFLNDEVLWHFCLWC